MTEINLFTVFSLVGPSNCGKSTFAKTRLQVQLENLLEVVGLPSKVPLLSSDELRMELLGDLSAEKYETRMLEVSRSAFLLLKAKLRAYLEFPLRTPFVIVDSTGLSHTFRAELEELCQKYEYWLKFILFSFSSYKAFFSFPGGNKRIISAQIQTLREQVLGSIRRNKLALVFKEPSELSEFEVKLPVEGSSEKPQNCLVLGGLEAYKKTILDPSKRYLIIGDVHETVDEVIALCEKVGFEVVEGIVCQTSKTANMELVFVGDLLDKGNKTRETLEFFWNNLQKHNLFHFVRGNHDKAVHKLLTGESKETSYKPNFLISYYGSYLILRTASDLKSKYEELYAQMQPFFFYSGEASARSFYVSHVPCHPKFLGKMTEEAQKHQCYVFFDRTKSFEEQFFRFQIPDSFNLPLHFAGHFPLAEPYLGYRKGSNFVLLDTGAIYGNRLTGALVGKDISTPRIYSIPFLSKQSRAEGEVIHLRTTLASEPPVSLDLFPPSQQKRVKRLIKDKVCFISGTISPANARKETLEFESLFLGISYYHSLLKTSPTSLLSLQPKYMGSRCNVYLYRDNLPRCFGVSRKGCRIDRKLLGPELIRPIWEKMLPFMKTKGIKLLVLDGELLPWSLLGEDLIEKEFRVPGKGFNTEVGILKETGFASLYADLLAKNPETLERNSQKGFQRDQISPFQLDRMETAGQIYEEQLALYGKTTEAPKFMPFSILKMVHEDNSERLAGFEEDELGQVEAFSLVSEDIQLVLNLKDPLEELLPVARAFFEKITQERKMEGIILKPDRYVPGKAPMLKVRNSSYLTLIYGPEYLLPDRLEHLIYSKDTRRKIKLSVEEYELGKRMLSFPMEEISEDNPEYLLTVAALLKKEEQEIDLDPRL